MATKSHLLTSRSTATPLFTRRACTTNHAWQLKSSKRLRQTLETFARLTRLEQCVCAFAVTYVHVNSLLSRFYYVSLRHSSFVSCFFFSLSLPASFPPSLPPSFFLSPSFSLSLSLSLLVSLFLSPSLPFSPPFPLSLLHYSVWVDSSTSCSQKWKCGPVQDTCCQ